MGFTNQRRVPGKPVLDDRSQNGITGLLPPMAQRPSCVLLRGWPIERKCSRAGCTACHAKEKEQHHRSRQAETARTIWGGRIVHVPPIATIPMNATTVLARIIAVSAMNAPATRSKWTTACHATSRTGVPRRITTVTCPSPLESGAPGNGLFLQRLAQQLDDEDFLAVFQQSRRGKAQRNRFAADDVDDLDQRRNPQLPLGPIAQTEVYPLIIEKHDEDIEIGPVGLEFTMVRARQEVQRTRQRKAPLAARRGPASPGRAAPARNRHLRMLAGTATVLLYGLTLCHRRTSVRIPSISAVPSRSNECDHMILNRSNALCFKFLAIAGRCGPRGYCWLQDPTTGRPRLAAEGLTFEWHAEE